MKQPYLSVVIPCYNEEANLKRGVLGEVDEFLAEQKYTSEVIVSDDESSDNSLALVQNFVKTHSRFRLLKNTHGGKAYAVRSGIDNARGEIVLFTDMDQSTPINETDKILARFRSGADIVIGSRGRVRKNAPWFRKLMALGFLLFRRLILLPGIVDTQCGFKALKTDIARKLFPQLYIFKVNQTAKGWRVGAFDVELLYLAQKRGYRIDEVVVNWQDQDTAKTKKQKFIKESKDMLKEILRVKLNDLRGMYQE